MIGKGPRSDSPTGHAYAVTLTPAATSSVMPASESCFSKFGPQRAGVGAGVDHEVLRPLHLVADREARRRGDEALDRHDPVLLDQLPRLLHRHARVGLVLGDQLDFPAEDAALFVQLLDRERGALLAVLADRAEEARERDELPDADGLLRPHDGGEREVVGPGRGAGGGEGEGVAAGGTGRNRPRAGHWGPPWARVGRKKAPPARVV